MSAPQASMPIADLATTMDQLATFGGGRTQTAKTLGAIFQRTSGPDEACILPYLLQGQLGPPFAAPNLGMGERRIAQAIAQAAHCPAGEVWRVYQQSGDLGSAATQFLGASSAAGVIPAPVLTVQEVYDRLCTIAASSGRGATQRKVEAFADLFRVLPAGAIPYVLRMAQGKLRLQIGDASLIDGLSFATVGSAALRTTIAHTYSVCSDLGLVAATLRSGGAAALAEIHQVPGRPVRAQLAERLPSVQAVVERMGTMLVELAHLAEHTPGNEQ